MRGGGAVDGEARMGGEEEERMSGGENETRSEEGWRG